MATKLLTAREVADMLGLHPVTVYTWAWSMRLPSVKLSYAMK